MANLEIPGLIADKKSGVEKYMTEAELKNARLKFAESQQYKSLEKKADAISDVLNGTMTIPDSLTFHHQMTLDEFKKQYPGHDVSRIEKQGVQSYVDLNGYGTGQPYWGIDQNPNHLMPQPYLPPNELDDYKKFLPEPKKYGPSPSRRQNPFDQELLKEMLNYGVKKKSAFEEILDTLFTRAEKEQTLIDMGYMLEHKSHPPGITTEDSDLVITRKLADGTIKTITNSLDDLFLKEITVKFKNLLMAKATLKLKL